MKKKIVKKEKSQDEESIVRRSAEELFSALGVEGEFSISKSEEGFDLELDTQESGIVIGYRGEILESLQLVLSLICAKKINRLLRITIEVDGYRKQRTDWLESVAAKAKEQALQEQRGVSIPNLRSWERRIVHLYLQDDSEVMSESVGQGRERVLVVKPRT